MAGRRSFGAIERLPSGRYRARYMVRGAWEAPRRARMSLDTYGQKWIEQRETLKATTRREYESCWRNHIGPSIGVHRLHATADHGRRIAERIAERMDELAVEPSSDRPIKRRAQRAH